MMKLSRQSASRDVLGMHLRRDQSHATRVTRDEVSEVGTRDVVKVVNHDVLTLFETREEYLPVHAATPSFLTAD
jgi:hypothetical protein